MNYEEIKQRMKDIERKSSERHRGEFMAVDGRWIISEEAHLYRDMISYLEARKEFDAFVSKNAKFVAEYEKYMEKLSQLEAAIGKAAKLVEETKKEKDDYVEVKRVITGTGDSQAKEKPELVEDDTKKVGVNWGSGDKDDKKDDTKSSDAPQVDGTKDTRPVLPEPIPVTDDVKKPLIDGVYGLKRGEIIQDMPVYSKETQSFTTPGMSNDAIIESQNKINSVPFANPNNIEDEIQKEIDRRRAEWESQQGKGYKPMTPEEIEASKKKLAETDPDKKTDDPIDNDPVVDPEDDKKTKKGKKRRVIKRIKFDWKNNFITKGITKSYLVLKGLIFGENMKGRTTDYMNICITIGNYRSSYKKRSPEVNNNELVNIDKLIASSTMLTLEEKKRLYKKLTKLARQVEKLNRRQQAKAMKNNKKIINEVDEELSMGSR